MNDKPKLDALRERIDALDDQLLELLNERGRIAQEVARVKHEAGDGDAIYRPAREAGVISRLAAANPGPLGGEDVARLFREIMSACRALEADLNIAYLGPEGTFTQTAAFKQFGHAVSTTALAGIDQVFREVEAGTCHYGVVPVENSIEGVINHTLDMLANSTLNICGEVELRIHQHLMARNDRPEAITKIYSHQQSLAQCRAWLDSRMPGVERVSVASNAEAARLASGEDGAAAIAGEAAAETYGLDILFRNIEDEPDNTTRFLVLGRESPAPTGTDKTSLLFSTANRPGALYGLLQIFAANNISMTRIESRPSRQGMWEYVFFVDVEGHARDKAVAAALHELERSASMFKLLGSYPRSVL